MNDNNMYGEIKPLSENELANLFDIGICGNIFGDSGNPFDELDCTKSPNERIKELGSVAVALAKEIIRLRKKCGEPLPSVAWKPID